MMRGELVRFAQRQMSFALQVLLASARPRYAAETVLLVASLSLLDAGIIDAWFEGLVSCSRASPPSTEQETDSKELKAIMLMLKLMETILSSTDSKMKSLDRRTQVWGAAADSVCFPNPCFFPTCLRRLTTICGVQHMEAEVEAEIKMHQAAVSRRMHAPECGCCSAWHPREEHH